MHKQIYFTVVLAMVTGCAVFAQKRATVSSATFKQLIGCWQGTLHYSGTIIRKPYTTTAALIVKQAGTSPKFELVHIYTQDAGEKVTDTIVISTDGSKLNNEIIISKQCTPEGNIEIITSSPGFDHDNDKAAIVRQTYTLGKQHYTYKKEVQLEGQTDWLERQEFTYTRIACTLKL